MTGTHKVLIADDDADLRGLLAEYLADKGYEVMEAGDGLEAFAKYHSLRPDIVVTDMNMPISSGRELTRQLHLLAPGLPIIVISGYYSKSELDAMRRLGARASVEKPFHPQELADLIRKLLRNTKEVPT